MLEDIRIFKGGRIDRAILYSASVLSKCCNTLSGLFRQIIEDRTDILYPVKDLEVHRGLGFSAWCDNNRILIGTRAYMEKEEVPLPDEEYEPSIPRTASCRSSIWPCPAVCTPCSCSAMWGDGTPPAVWNSCKKRISSCWCPARTPP